MSLLILNSSTVRTASALYQHSTLLIEDESPRMASSLDQIKFQTTASRQYLIAWSTLLIWDWLATLPVEIEHVWLKKKTPLRITFLLNRYGTILLNQVSMALIISDVSTGMIFMCLLSLTFEYSLTPFELAGVCGKLFWIERLTLVWVLVSVSLSAYNPCDSIRAQAVRH